MSSPRVRAFARVADQWLPDVGDTVFIRIGKGIRRITARGVVQRPALLHDSFEVLIVRKIGCCCIRKSFVFSVDDLRPIGEVAIMEYDGGLSRERATQTVFNATAAWCKKHGMRFPQSIREDYRLVITGKKAG